MNSIYSSQILLENRNKNDRTIESNIFILYFHILKFACQEQVQTRSWIESIKKIFIKLNSNSFQRLYNKKGNLNANTINDIKIRLPKIYNDAYNDMIMKAYKYNERYHEPDKEIVKTLSTDINILFDLDRLGLLLCSYADNDITRKALDDYFNNIYTRYINGEFW